MVVSSLQLVVFLHLPGALRKTDPRRCANSSRQLWLSNCNGSLRRRISISSGGECGVCPHLCWYGMVWWKKPAEVQMCLRNRRYLETLGSGYLISVINRDIGYLLSTVIISCLYTYIMIYLLRQQGRQLHFTTWSFCLTCQVLCCEIWALSGPCRSIQALWHGGTCTCKGLFYCFFKRDVAEILHVWTLVTCPIWFIFPKRSIVFFIFFFQDLGLNNRVYGRTCCTLWLLGCCTVPVPVVDSSYLFWANQSKPHKDLTIADICIYIYIPINIYISII